MSVRGFYCLWAHENLCGKHGGNHMKSPGIKACKFMGCPLCFKDSVWHLWRWATFAERPNSRNSVRPRDALICHCPICQAGPRKKPLRQRVQNDTPGAKGQKLSCPRLIRVWLHTGLRKKNKNNLFGLCSTSDLLACRFQRGPELSGNSASRASCESFMDGH